MTEMTDERYNELLLEATTRLIDEFSSRIQVGRIVGAIGRAKSHVRSGYRLLVITAPPPDEYVSLVVGLARQELFDLVGPRIRAGRALGLG
jgi:hypothetical protein